MLLREVFTAREAKDLKVLVAEGALSSDGLGVVLLFT